MNINEWAEEDRPREKLIARGAATLSLAELLAILIGSGSSDESAVDLMRRVMADCDGRLKRLSRMKLHELTAYKGMGPAKAVTIMAACELGRRRMMEAAEEKRTITSALDLYRIMLPRMRDLGHEECYAIYLRADHSLNGQPYLVSKGGITGTAVDVRLVLREALMRRAPFMALAHNHPSGSIRPSREDDHLTESVQRACQVMNVQLLDHVIVTDGEYYSYKEQGKV